MESTSRNVAGVGSGVSGWWTEIPFLLVLVLAPQFASQLQTGFQSEVETWNLVRTMCLGGLVWLSWLFRLLPSQPPIRLPRWSPLALAFPLWAALSFVVSANRGATVSQVLAYAAFTATLFLAADIAARGGGGRVVTAILAGALIAATIGVQEYISHWKVGEAAWRTFGNFTNPNLLAGYLVPVLLLALGLALYQPEALRGSVWLLVSCLICAILTGAELTTGSRGGFLSLGAGIVVLLLWGALRGAFRQPGVFARVGAVAVVLVLIGVLASGSLRNREGGATQELIPHELCEKATQTPAGESNRFRVYTWKGTLNMGLRRPVLGWGAGSFASTFAAHAVADYTRHAHQTYLQYFAEMGIPGALLWIALLLAGAVSLWKQPRGEPAFFWNVGVAAALAGSAFHNLFDSILYVPASGFAVWTLLGLALAAPAQAPAPVPTPEPVPAGGSRAERRRAGRVPASTPLSADKRLRLAGLGIGGGVLVLSLLHAYAYTLLMQARDDKAVSRTTAYEMLQTAQALIPWEPQVATDQSRILSLSMGRPEDALAAAQRAIDLAPYRPIGYYERGRLFNFYGDLNKAALTYDVGIQHLPNEVELLMARAQVAKEQGLREDASEMYHRIAQVAAGPIAQVRALSEVLDPQFATAWSELAREADAKGKPEEAAAYRKEAACLLSMRRIMFERSPRTYAGVGQFNWRTPKPERDLRDQEEALWKQVAKDYRTRGENHLAELSEKQAGDIEASRELLEKIIREFQEFMQQAS